MDRGVVAHAQNPAQRQIVQQPGVRHAAGARQHPPGARPPIGPECPTPTVGQVDERKHRLGRSAQGRATTNRVEITHRRAVARQQQVIAVVDRQAQLAIEIRPAPPAGSRPGLVHRHGPPAIDQRKRRRQPGEAGANHVDRPGHHWQAGAPGHGAGDGNRTRITSLEGWGSTIELHPHKKTRMTRG